MGPWALTPPRLTFIGAFSSGSPIDAKPSETFPIGSGAAATIADFSLTAGDRLNLTGLLAGAPLAHDLSNLGAFVSVTWQGPDPNGGTDTTLSCNGPGGSATVTLVTSKPIAVADPLNGNALILPAH